MSWFFHHSNVAIIAIWMHSKGMAKLLNHKLVLLHTIIWKRPVAAGCSILIQYSKITLSQIEFLSANVPQQSFSRIN